MSHSQYIKIPTLSDKTVIKAFEELAEKYPVKNSNGSTLGGQTLGPLINMQDDELTPAWITLLRLDSALIDNFSIQIGGFSIVYFRGGHKEPEEKSPFFDTIRLDYNPQNGDVSASNRLEIVAFLNNRLKAFDPNRSINTSVSIEAKHLEALTQSRIERLEQVAEQVIKRTTETQSRLEEDYAQRRKKLEEEAALEKVKLASDFQNEHSRLQEREKALDSKLQEIDNRNNTHARRQIRDRMLDDVKNRIENFGVSETTTAKRRPVEAGIFLLIAILFTLLALTIYEVHRSGSGIAQLAVSKPPITGAAAPVASAQPTAGTDRTYLYFLYARLTLLSLGLLAAMLYYIRWQNKWAEQHATSEFQLQQFYIDVNRANWVIESGLEWRKETNTDMPDQLLASVTRNVFNSHSEPETVLHPADELASALMGSASKVKLKVADNELEFDKPKKIPNSVKSTSAD